MPYEQPQQSAAAAATAVWQHTTGQQQQQQKYMPGIYKYILVRRAAAYSIIVIYQIQVLCYETAHGVYVTKRETTTSK